jgi:acyl-coenzyme A thioesterase PaaI-like protein
MNYNLLKMTALVNGYSLFKIPLLAFITPQFIALDEQRAEVRVRLDMRTRNHLGVMYFGALAMGAELSIASMALRAISDSGKKIDFIFKDFRCEFLKRAAGHVHFVCEETTQVAKLVHAASADSERHNKTFSGYAFVPSESTEPVMKYHLTLSVKQRSPKH